MTCVIVGTAEAAAFPGPGDEPWVFASRWSGDPILVASHPSLAGALARFDFGWVIPRFVKYRRLRAEVPGISVMRRFVALIRPLFFQVITGKLLLRPGMTTLHMLVVRLAAVVVFESPRAR